MPLPISPTIRLNGLQIGQLVYILCEVFDHHGLEHFVRQRLAFELYDQITGPDQALKVIAESLVVQLNEPGTLRIYLLLQNLVVERPLFEPLWQFVERVCTGVESTHPETMMVLDAFGAAANLALMNPTVRQQLVPFRPPLEVTIEELTRLQSYKGLHDCLHTVQLQLAAFARASRAFPGDATAAVEINTYLEVFQRIATAARDHAQSVPTREDELAWIEEFALLLRTAQDAISALQQEPIRNVVPALYRLLPEAVRINVALTMSAKNLRLEMLGRVLTVVVYPDPIVIAQLRAGSDAISGLRPQLASLVDAHDNWQRVDKALMAAEALPPGPPAQRVPRWNQVRPMLARLCPPGTESTVLADPATLAERWEAEKDPKLAEVLFLSLRAAALHKFYDVDVRLRDLTARLADIVAPLDSLLEVI